MPDEVLAEPVVDDRPEDATLEPEERRLEDGIALCLSGGGYRAMVFHLGALWRLNEAGILRDLKRVSSVSGGSITAAHLGLQWRRLEFDGRGVAGNFEQAIVEPILALASKTIDVQAILRGVFLPGSVSGRIEAAYRTHLYGSATLQDLPADSEGPRFVVNAANLQSGALWRFSRPYMADYLVGMVDRPEVSLAAAVAASSAFPPVLSPLRLPIPASAYRPDSRGWLMASLQSTGVAVLSDGGVYDNLGLETAFKRYRTLLVSDGGGALTGERRIARDWARQSIRVMGVIDRQVRALRKRQLLQAFGSTRQGTYWSIRSEIPKYGLADPIDVNPQTATELAAIPTRLARMPASTQRRLVNWGYAICDTALRRWVRPDLERPGGLPFPGSPIGR